jgi:uncharacterized protein YegL
VNLFNCGLFSTHQIDPEDYMKVNMYDDLEYPEMNLEAHNSFDRKHWKIALLIDITPSSKPAKRKPLNLCFALDRSGSMEKNNRMEKLKEAMKDIISYLAPGDYLSIVTYDDVAQVVLPAQQYLKENDSLLMTVIERITIGGGTNMLAGMLRGYLEINKHYDRQYRNRLILMSDGVSTAGEKDPAKIIQHTINYYTSKGIETSTVGIGKNINFNLLHSISVEGRGKSHFVGDCDSAYVDINYALREEFRNMHPNMDDIKIEVSNPKYFKIADVYGASKTMVMRDKTIIYSSNMSNKTQLILVKFLSKRKQRKDILTVNLTFAENGEQRNIIKQVDYVKNDIAAQKMDYINNNASSEKMALANQILESINHFQLKIKN